MENMLIISNIILWLVVIFLSVIVFALARQIGVLYERVAPAGALAINQSISAGAAAPELSVQSLQGELITVGKARTDGRSQLLFFLSPDCPVCKQLLVPLKSAARSEQKWLSVILASDGGHQQQHEEFIAQHALSEFPYVISELLGKSYGISKLPYAVLINEEGIIESLGIINSREHLESLFEAKERGVSTLQSYMEARENSQEQYYAAQVENKS